MNFSDKSDSLSNMSDATDVSDYVFTGLFATYIDVDVMVGPCMYYM